jgi:hypothetical protein
MTLATLSTKAPLRAPAGMPGLDTAAAPPPSLPGEHFAAALVFFTCGTLGLAVVAPELAGGHFFAPRVAAVVHLFVLGWITLSIFGALCQFMPVAVGRPMRWLPLAHVSFGCHVLGVTLFVTALAAGLRHVLHVGATLLAVAFVTFATNLGASLASAKPTERSLTWWALAGATLFLVVTPIYGVLLALSLHGEVAVADRFAFIAVHAHAALVGFVMLVIVGVAHRLLPMFLLSHGASERPAWASAALLFAGALVLALPVGGRARLLAAGVLAAGGVLAFIAQAFLFFRHRKRKAVDPGMRLAGVGLVGLTCAVGIAPLALSRGLADLHLLTAYFIVLIGGLSLFVAGHYYKIVPFIVWYHRFGPLIGKRKVPKVAELYSERVALLDAALLVLGWLGVAAGTYAGAATLVRGAALVFAVGASIEAYVIARVAQRRAA